MAWCGVALGLLGGATLAGDDGVATPCLARSSVPVAFTSSFSVLPSVSASDVAVHSRQLHLTHGKRQGGWHAGAALSLFLHLQWSGGGHSAPVWSFVWCAELWLRGSFLRSQGRKMAAAPAPAKSTFTDN